VKSINFLNKSAVAIYFYDMTHHLESLKSESDLLFEKSQFKSWEQTTISKEFRAPLTTSLMFLESLLG